MDNGCVILFVHFAGFFPVSSLLLDLVLERIMLGYFGALCEDVSTPSSSSSSAFDIPKSWSIIPDFYSVESCCVTFT